MRRVCILLAAAGLFTGCGGGSEPEGAPAKEGPVVAQAVTPEETPEPLATVEADLPTGETLPGDPEQAETRPARVVERGILSSADKASFQRLSRSLGGANGIAVSGIGAGQQVETVGSLKTGTAWSTIKVPIAMAVIDAGGAEQHAGDLTKAITASDNAAAERLWASLGAPDTAAQAVTAQLSNADDNRTQVNSQKLLAAYTPFGQTGWALSAQARFAAQLPCSAAGVQVLDLMGQIVGGQRWGLGTAQNAQFKGGWGPGSTPGREGGYLDRQLGIITVRGTPLAVAIASRPANGSHDTGTRNLTELARWLSRNASIKGLPAQPGC